MIDEHGTTYVDNTTLRAMADCDSRVVLRHVLGFTVDEEKVKLEAGIAVHEVMASYFGGRKVEHCLAQFEMLYRGYSEELGLNGFKHPLGGYSWENLDKILNEWFARDPRATMPFSVNPKLIEIGIQVPLSDECVCGFWEHNHPRPGCDGYRPAFVMWGRLDAIVTAHHDKKLYVLDHKSTGRLSTYTTEKYRMDSQMSGYTWAAQKTLGQDIAGIFINAIEFSKLPSDPVRKCAKHGVIYAECGPMHMNTQLLIYTRTATQLEQWRQDAIKLARRYRDLARNVKSLSDLTSVSMDGTFAGACGFCEFAKFCQAERSPSLEPSMLIYNPWQPFSHKATSS